MPIEVPPDFDEPWMLSDVVLHTLDGKSVYAFKGALAMFSPYFHILFYGNYKESTATAVNVDCEYDIMVEILRNIHQIGYKYDVGQTPYPTDMLVKMYKAADLYDIDIIVKLCRDHMLGYTNAKMAKAAGDLELYDTRSIIFAKLTKEESKEFLKQPPYELSKVEFLMLFTKLFDQALPQPPVEKPKGALNLENITKELENPRVDLTKPWDAANLAIATRNAKGRLLYANKTMVEVICPNFKKYLCRRDELHLEAPQRSLAYVDVDYTTMKEILSIIHHCKVNGKDDRVLHPALLHSMYCAAHKKRLDIPLIRNKCVTKLMEHKSPDALDVFCSIDCFSSMATMMDEMETLDLRDWIYRNDNFFSYHNGRKAVSLTPPRDLRFLHNGFALPLFRIFADKFFPGMP